LFDFASSYTLYAQVLERVGQFKEADEFYGRATKIRKRRVELLERTASTTEDRIRLSRAYDHLAGDQALQLKDYQAATENLRRAQQIAERVFAEDTENKSAVFAAGTTAFGLGLVLKRTGDVRGALEAFRKSLKFARLSIARWPSGYFERKEYDCLMEIAEGLHELGEPDQALEALRESFDLRRKQAERDKDTLRSYQGLYYGGAKLLTRMKRLDAALAKFSEAEQSHLKVLARDPNQISNRRNLATLYMTLGDFHAGLGVCDFERAKDYDALSQSYQYCPPELKPRANGRVNSEARAYYQKAADILTQLKAENFSEHIDLKNLDLAQAKLQASGGSSQLSKLTR
jgi:tetratricopeptide (TPR) repeat protein